MAGVDTYTFTPDDGQCATPFTLNVNIANPNKPMFNAIGPLCQNSYPPKLPVKSANMISGTWSPATINTDDAGTKTYTFIPTPGQCADTVEMGIVVNARTIPTFNPIEPICINSVAPPLPTISTNIPAITGTWNPSAINTTLVGAKAYIFTPASGLCATKDTLIVKVTAPVTPAFEEIGPLCVNSLPPDLPSTSLNGFSGTWNPTIISTGQIGTFSYIFTPEPGQCAVNDTLNITVVVPDKPIFHTIDPLCLNSSAPELPVSSSDGISGTWNPSIISTAEIGTTAYVFIPYPGQCATNDTLNVTVVLPVKPLFEIPAALCQNSSKPLLPPTSSNGIKGNWNPLTITTEIAGKSTYIFTPDADQCALADTAYIIINPTVTSTTSATACTNQLPYIWNGQSFTASGTFTAMLVSASGCDSLATLDLNVVRGDTPLFTQIGPLIQNSVPPALPATSSDGITGTWSPTEISTARAGKSTYTFNPDPDVCAGFFSMEVAIDIQAVIAEEDSIPGAAGIQIGACENITLDASKSKGENLKYEWSLPDQGGSLTSYSDSITEFMLSPDYAGSLPVDIRVRLHVADLNGYTDSDTLLIHIEPLPVAAVSSNGKLQKDGSMIVDGSGSTGTQLSYKWSTSEGRIIGADDQPSASFFGAGMYKLVITDIHGCPGTKDFHFPLEAYSITARPDNYRITWAQDTVMIVLANDSSSAPFASVRVIKPASMGTTSINNDFTITYTPTVRTPGVDQFIYEVGNVGELCDSALVTIEIYDSNISIPQGFSPNGDGLNDILEFKGLENYKNSGLYIYTRSGQTVYRSGNYLNDWDGKTKINKLDSQSLVPPGTYYYVLKLGQTNRIIKGFIYIGY